MRNNPTHSEHWQIQINRPELFDSKMAKPSVSEEVFAQEG